MKLDTVYVRGHRKRDIGQLNMEFELCEFHHIFKFQVNTQLFHKVIKNLNTSVIS